MLPNILFLTVLSCSLVSICNGIGHDYISPENFEEFHDYLSQIKKREVVDTILSEVGTHVSLAKGFEQQTSRRFIRISREKLDEREQNRRRRYIQRRQRRIRVKHAATDNYENSYHKKTLSLAKATTMTLASKTFGT